MKKNSKSGDIRLEEAPAAPPPQPLFFVDPVPLDAALHAKAGLKTAPDFRFARATNTLPLNAQEFNEAAKHYPIVFTAGEDPFPMAMVGLEDSNYFVNGDGTWKPGAYIPAYVRKYPFAFSQTSTDQFVLCVDQASAHYRKSAGKGVEPFFDKKGEASAMSLRALEFCKAFQQQHGGTRQFAQDLKQAGLLMPYTSDVKLPGGRKLRVTGFWMIDARKLDEMPDAAFLGFRQKGYLPLIYLALASTSNWRSLGEMAKK